MAQRASRSTLSFLTLYLRWWLIGLLSATATAGYLCRVNLSVAGALLMEEFHLSQVEMGRVFSAFLLGYALCQVPAAVSWPIGSARAAWSRSPPGGGWWPPWHRPPSASGRGLRARPALWRCSWPPGS